MSLEAKVLILKLNLLRFKVVSSRYGKLAAGGPSNGAFSKTRFLDNSGLWVSQNSHFLLKVILSFYVATQAHG